MHPTRCGACARCLADAWGRCIYGGPFRFVLAAPIDERRHLGTVYPGVPAGSWAERLGQLQGARIGRSRDLVATTSVL